MAVTYSSSPRDTNLSGIEVVSTSRWCLNVHNYDSQLIGIQLEHTLIFVQSCFSKWYISLASNFVLPFLYTTGLICSCYFQYHSHVVDQSIWNSDIYISEVQMASGRRVKKEDQQSENRTNREYDHQPETSINCQRSWTAARLFVRERDQALDTSINSQRKWSIFNSHWYKELTIQNVWTRRKNSLTKTADIRSAGNAFLMQQSRSKPWEYVENSLYCHGSLIRTDNKEITINHTNSHPCSGDGLLLNTACDNWIVSLGKNSPQSQIHSFYWSITANISCSQGQMSLCSPDKWIQVIYLP